MLSLNLILAIVAVIVALYMLGKKDSFAMPKLDLFESTPEVSSTKKNVTSQMEYSEMLAHTELDPETHQSHKEFVKDSERNLVRTVGFQSEPSHDNNPVPWAGLRYAGGSTPYVSHTNGMSSWTTSETDSELAVLGARFERGIRI